ncbi:MAG: NUDIX hydrolase [Treponema sp.]|nr:NUDIX hydrolase [Treponema sp.]
MEESKLAWKEEGKKNVFDCQIFSIYESYSRSPEKKLRTFTVIDAADWVITIPVLETPQGKKFVMVRQWRHASHSLSLEFPGGVSEPGETPWDAAAREMLEETGYKPGKMRGIGEFSSNPAIMSNKVHFFLAEDLIDTGERELDSDEYVETELVSVDAVIRGMGQPPYIHALMGSAMALYLQTAQRQDRL